MGVLENRLVLGWSFFRPFLRVNFMRFCSQLSVKNITIQILGPIFQ